MLLKKIVVAEDDDAIAHMVSMSLGDAGFLCLRARDGDEALRLVKAHDPDLLVLDVMMPRMDGLEVARRLKSDVVWSRTPILMLTALAAVDSQVQGLEAGADAYMSKPFDLREFGARCRALIRGARRERDRNPTTDLPGSRAIDDQIELAVKSTEPMSAVHIDVAGFDAFADVIGFGRAEAAVKSLAQVIVAVARNASGGGAFVGHVGGSDFICLVPIAQSNALCEELVAEFHRRQGELLGAEGASLSLVAAIAPVAAEPAAAPATASATAPATTPATASATAGDEVARRLGVAMREAKALGKSGFVAWRRS